MKNLKNNDELTLVMLYGTEEEILHYLQLRSAKEKIIAQISKITDKINDTLSNEK